MDAIARVSVPTATRAPTGTTNAYVVGKDDGVLIDPGDTTDELDRVVDRRDVGAVAVTHTHSDHVGGVAAYARGRTVWAHDNHLERFTKATGVDPDRTFVGDDQLPGGVQAVETPGHAIDHVAYALVDHDRNSIVCGDLAVATGSVVVAPPDGDMRSYLDSLRRLRDRDPAVLYPGHGAVIRDPRSTLTRLITHRLDRERRVLAAVADGVATPTAITERAYEKDLSGVRDLAVATVIGHLEKLAADGQITFDGERARPT